MSNTYPGLTRQGIKKSSNRDFKIKAKLTSIEIYSINNAPKGIIL